MTRRRGRSSGGGVLPIPFRPFGTHPEQHLLCYAGLMQADAYAGFNRLYEVPASLVRFSRSCLLGRNARRKFSIWRGLNKAPTRSKRYAVLMRCSRSSREINGLLPEARLKIRRERSRPLMAELETWPARTAQEALRKERYGKKPSITASSAGRRLPATVLVAADGRISEIRQSGARGY